MMFCRCLSESEAGLPTLPWVPQLSWALQWTEAPTDAPLACALPFCRWQLANGRVLTKALGPPSGKLPQLVARSS